MKFDSLPVQGVQKLIEGECGKLSDREVGLIVREAFPFCSRKRLGVARVYHYVGLLYQPDGTFLISSEPILIENY